MNGLLKKQCLLNRERKFQTPAPVPPFKNFGSGSSHSTLLVLRVPAPQTCLQLPWSICIKITFLTKYEVMDSWSLEENVHTPRICQILKHSHFGFLWFSLWLLIVICASSLRIWAPVPPRETGCDPAIPAQLCWSSGSSFPQTMWFDGNLTSYTPSPTSQGATPG